MIYKLRNDGYLQVWDDDRKNCVSLGKADKLVKALNNDDQTKKLRDKLTNLLSGERR
jgi:hypothetical protein